VLEEGHPVLRPLAIASAPGDAHSSRMRRTVSSTRRVSESSSPA
jgi:hypothetical protein